MKEILKHYTLLYAEDDKEVQVSTVEYLKRYFSEVYVANEGKEALALYDRHHPDALLLDIDMPKVDGLSVAHKIRQSNEAIPIVMLTAFTDTEKLLKATELNLCKYLVKPSKMQEFKEALEKVSLKLQSSNAFLIKLNEGYVWDGAEGVLFHDREEVTLSHKEQTLLSLFMTHYQCCVSFEEIMAVVWEDDFDKEISIDAVKYHVSQLRKVLPEESIKSVYGKGYMFS